MKDISYLYRTKCRNALFLMRTAPDLAAMTRVKLQERLYEQCHSFKFQSVSVCLAPDRDEETSDE